MLERILHLSLMTQHTQQPTKTDPEPRKHGQQKAGRRVAALLLLLLVVGVVSCYRFLSLNNNQAVHSSERFVVTNRHRGLQIEKH